MNVSQFRQQQEEGFNTHTTVPTTGAFKPHPRSNVAQVKASRSPPPAFGSRASAGAVPFRTHQVGVPASTSRPSKMPATTATATRINNPYQTLVSPPLHEVLPAEFRQQLTPNSQHHRANLDKLINGGSFVTFHDWESIRLNAAYEEDKLHMPSSLQPMDALTGTSSMTRWGLHMGQFLHSNEFREQNFLTLRLLADLSGTTLYKCDFDSNNCCRIFLDGAQSYERVLAFSKRLRVTTYGVLVAHNEAAALDLELAHFGSRVVRMPYHSIPIEAMRTSHETSAARTGAFQPYRSQQTQLVNGHHFG